MGDPRLLNENFVHINMYVHVVYTINVVITDKDLNK
jgi:hypothetical protein